MNSLFSLITTLYALALLYSPSFISPVLLSTFILLLYLLQLGAAQRSTIKPSNSTQSLPPPAEEFRDGDHKRDSDQPSTIIQRKSESFLEWDVRAPLEVIQEEYEGEDAEENDCEAKRESQLHVIRRYASLSLFYPDSDGESSSEGDFPANVGWEEDDDGESLIEIAFDEKGRIEVDDENLIEIDLSR